MRKPHKFCAVVVLTVALGLPAFAGVIGSPGGTNPPPPTTESTDPNDIHQPGRTDGNISTPGAVDPVDSVTEFTLSLLQSVLSLF